MRAIFPELRQVRMIPGAGHMVQLEASAEVNAILLEFLGDIERSNSPDLQL
jgi:pimeloyl-ACP methyl ester carboxylesterase